MEKTNKKTQVPFKQVIAALLDTSKLFPPMHLNRFSDLAPDDLAALTIAWPDINPDRRAALLQDLEDLDDSDTLVSFIDLAKFTLDDTDPRVRASSINLLWDNSDPALITPLIKLMLTDPDEIVRASAASGLGMFVYSGEVEEIPAEKHRFVEDNLLKVMQSADKPIVRRRALESLGFSSREEIPALIESSYSSGDPEWLASSLFAMGRSSDPHWAEHIMNQLDHGLPDVQLEAVRAAGELGLSQSREPILEMLEEDAEGLDDEVRMAAIWALSNIGGEGVREALEKLAEATEDDDELDLVDEALENLSFMNGSGAFGMVDLAAPFDQEHTHVIDLEKGEEYDEDDIPEDHSHLN